MQTLIDFLNQRVRLDSRATELLKSLVEVEHFAKNETILEIGEYCRKIWFIESGMVRKFHLQDEKEITCWIHTEQDIFTSLNSYTQQVTSFECIQACEPTELMSISRKSIPILMANPEFRTIAMQLIEQTFTNIDTHTKAFYSKDAKAKYEYLKSIAPQATKRAKLGHLASILGISQATLSRIRKK